MLSTKQISLLFLLLITAQVVKASEPFTVNKSHLLSLIEKVKLNGDSVCVVDIYADYPTYKPVEAKGEGFACVDDAARAAIFLIRYNEVFHKDADDAVNYGAIGTVIGHEMTHGFDDQGRQYDLNGNLKDWWQHYDDTSYSKHVQVLVFQYNRYLAIDTIHLNGMLTLGENIADLGGVTVAFQAFKNAIAGKSPQALDGFSPDQRFFLSYAQIWRQNIRPEELMKRVQEDVHSPAKFRINGVLCNVPQFYDAFAIKKGDPLYLDPTSRAKIW